MSSSMVLWVDTSQDKMQPLLASKNIYLFVFFFEVEKCLLFLFH
jgi:hypothetical protein